jgi:hypothetical protein
MVILADDGLVRRVTHTAGYSRCGLTRASFVENRQFALTWALLRLTRQAAISSARVCVSEMPSSRH